MENGRTGETRVLRLNVCPAEHCILGLQGHRIAARTAALQIRGRVCPCSKSHDAAEDGSERPDAHVGGATSQSCAELEFTAPSGRGVDGRGRWTVGDGAVK